MMNFNFFSITRKTYALEFTFLLQDQEAKIELMRQQTRQKYNLTVDSEPVIKPPSNDDVCPEHINFFKDLEEGAVVTNAKNEEHEKEIKDEKEKYEKQIGYLTYLGQDTNEATGKVSWYNVPRSTLTTTDDNENDVKKKSKLDPICVYKHLFNKYKFTPKKASEKPKLDDLKSSKKTKKHKKHKKHKSNHKKHRRASSSESSSSDSSSSNDSSKKIAQLRILREQRLKREREEKLRAEKLLAKMRGEVVVEKEPEPPKFEQKYNSQFNPHLARQNAK